MSAKNRIVKNWTRKEFLNASLLAGGASVLAPRRTVAAGGRSANDEVRVAVIGIRGKGASHIRHFNSLPGVTVAALCDVDETVIAREVAKLSEQKTRVVTHTDFRRVLDDKSIDAVVIATPNHWHSLMAIMACQAGKDVYVEKPISHNVWEGRKVVEAAQRYQRIVQVGTQSRSDEALKEAFAYIHAGQIGKILWARGLCYKLRESIGRSTGPQPVPPGLDYDLWTGPAPLVPPRRNSAAKGAVHYDWHWFWNYGGGDIANQGVHEMDMCRWALGQDGLPASVMSFGGRFGYDDDAETPNTQVAIFDYEPAPLIFEVRGLPMKAGMKAMDAFRGIRVGLVVQCEHGYFAGGGGGGFVYDHAGKRQKEFTSSGGGGHQANFIAAVRSRKATDLNAPSEDGHISSALCNIGNISYRLGRETTAGAVRAAVEASEPTADSLGRMFTHLEANEVPIATTPVVLGPTLQLAAGKESFITRENYDLGYWANTMLSRDYREPFVVPDKV